MLAIQVSAQSSWGYQIHSSASQRLVVVLLDIIPLLEIVNVKILRFLLSLISLKQLAQKHARLAPMLGPVKHARLAITSLVQVVSPAQEEHILILLHPVQVYEKLFNTFH